MKVSTKLLSSTTVSIIDIRNLSCQLTRMISGGSYDTEAGLLLLTRTTKKFSLLEINKLILFPLLAKATSLIFV